MDKLINELLKNYDEILFYLEKIEGIASEQIRLIKNGDLTQLNSILERKDELIGRMAQLQDVVEEKLSLLESSPIPYSERHSCEQKALMIQDKVNEIIKNEHNNLHKIVKRKTDVFAILKKVPEGKRVLHSYQKSVGKKQFENQWEG
ncbi:hypothetical protein J7L67_02560 [bacterium]|nr:hypothetical protein [bacterium]